MGDGRERLACSVVVDLGNSEFGRRGHEAWPYLTGPRKGISEQLATFNFKIDPSPPTADFPRLHMLATAHHLTAYDVAYLDLAKRLSLPLATRDNDLRTAAMAEDVQTI